MLKNYHDLSVLFDKAEMLNQEILSIEDVVDFLLIAAEVDLFESNRKKHVLSDSLRAIRSGVSHRYCEPFWMNIPENLNCIVSLKKDSTITPNLYVQSTFPIPSKSEVWDWNRVALYQQMFDYREDLAFDRRKMIVYAMEQLFTAMESDDSDPSVTMSEEVKKALLYVLRLFLTQLENEFETELTERTAFVRHILNNLSTGPIFVTKQMVLTNIQPSVDIPTSVYVPAVPPRTMVIVEQYGEKFVDFRYKELDLQLMLNALQKTKRNLLSWKKVIRDRQKELQSGASPTVEMLENLLSRSV
ncbi:hypothetical protein [Risungbinella massiliensis]|uniref:hypothetical protein n=1 Tax=Risungbinella massiliensis TaxID=1329796 RepID=UPI0005CBA8C0|nr:hypothetical protein [Risungbinella massiliensis]